MKSNTISRQKRRLITADTFLHARFESKTFGKRFYMKLSHLFIYVNNRCCAISSSYSFNDVKNIQKY